MDTRENSMNTDWSKSQDFVVAVDKTDCYGNLKPGAWLEYMQDVATAHAEQLGIGLQRMKAENLIWVVTKISLRIHRPLQLAESFRCTTTLKKPSRVETCRDYRFYDAEGRLAASGTSTWCVLDLNARSLRRVNELFPFPDEAFSKEDAVSDAPRKIEIDCPVEAAYSSRVFFCDMDRNLHLNNAKYGDMLLNACPGGYFETRTVSGFDLAFKRELRFGDEFSVSFGECADGYFVRANGTEDEVFSARVWI